MTMEHRESKETEHDHKTLSEADFTVEPVDGEILNWNSLTSSDSEMTRESTMLDIDRMVNEGLGGGYVTEDNGMIGFTTTDTMKTVDETPGNTEKGE
ncbi:hypothetical protein SAMN05661091_0913 [Paenibacillus uliginis N3/975]|uniref:Uncharacterized protein n=1 Tax=Paenibacillus uliginis N3/975 TaxID=1313296 RepID=A0A1X7GQ98_9BACL|nr:hypothetical protein [Paenibacillus uliginis]SMF72882.1 hypothetical protein SAMN05661091_0913 [Paenibacillus uliginis N3/975]